VVGLILLTRCVLSPHWAFLGTRGFPDPDLLIRTGGGQRLSSFLIWQAAYSELWTTPVLWPDFKVEHLDEALHDYARRKRRFGSISDEPAQLNE
jgi:undecaprenyl diphosphate synthase